MIAYVCPESASPSGGIQTLYRHVDLLVASGRDARIVYLAQTTPPPAEWFPSTTPITSLGELKDYDWQPDRDLWVFPEVYGPTLHQMLVPGADRLIFNQNHAYTFAHYPTPPEDLTPCPYRDPSVKGVMWLTETEAAHGRWAFPTLPHHVVPHGIDPAVFYVPAEPKRRQIAYMPRKHADEAQQVFAWLHYRGALDGWTVVPLNGMRHERVAAVLRESLVFFAFGYPEGGTLPPFEAMASGCCVIGYGGFASDLDIAAMGGFLIPSGDTMRFALVADAMLRLPDRCDTLGLESARKVAATFTLARERDALLVAMEAVGR